MQSTPAQIEGLFCQFVEQTALHYIKGFKMTKIILIFLLLSLSGFCICEIAGSQEGLKGDGRNALDDFIMAIINHFKDIIVDGNECLGIPPLDPLHIPGLPLNVNTSLLKMIGNVSNVESTGLKNLGVSSLSCNLLTLAIDLVMEMPSFYIGGNYSVDGLALIIFPIYGKGPFSLELENFKINGTGQLGARLNGTLYMKELDFTMEMEEMAIRFEGLLGGGELGDVLNEIINQLGLAVYNGVRAIIHDTLMSAMVSIINFSLKDVTLADIIGGIIKPPVPDDGCGMTTTTPCYFNCFDN